MKNQRDTEPDEDLDNGDDIDTDDPDGDDTDDSDSQPDNSDTDDGDEDAIDEDGYTKAEREELETIQGRYKSASDKISRDGQRIKELEAENERLNSRLKGHADDTREDDEEPEPRKTRRSQRDADETEDEIDLEAIDFSDIDMTKLDPNTRKAFERMYDATSRVQKHSKTVSDQLAKSEAENKRLKAEDDRYQKYKDTYGLSREQFAEVREAMDSGDDIEAHRLLTIHSAAHKRRQERSESLSDDRSYLSNGSPDSPPSSNRKTRKDQLQEAFDNAKTDKEKTAISQQIWEEFDAHIAEEMTLPSPVS